jgi:fructose-1,6-bisphosphatase/inositol monophosphatase family enzyme
VAASIIIVKEAGGYVDFLDLQAKESVKRNIIATNSAIHDELKNNILKNIIE